MSYFSFKKEKVTKRKQNKGAPQFRGTPFCISWKKRKGNQKKTVQGCAVEMRCAFVFVPETVGACIARPRTTDGRPYKNQI